MHESKQEATKVVSLVKTFAETLPDVFSPIKTFLIENVISNYITSHQVTNLRVHKDIFTN